MGISFSLSLFLFLYFVLAANQIIIATGQRLLPRRTGSHRRLNIFCAHKYIPRPTGEREGGGKEKQPTAKTVVYRKRRRKNAFNYLRRNMQFRRHRIHNNNVFLYRYYIMVSVSGILHHTFRSTIVRRNRRLALVSASTYTYNNYYYGEAGGGRRSQLNCIRGTTVVLPDS